jgi:pimeloyl-ACP methyl ester carboxylesterase
MTEQLVTVDEVELCLESFGDPADPALLLIGGAASSMDWWDVRFCRRLADAGRFVIRYDHRDTGRSETSPVGKPGYTGVDLTADALRILDALGVRRAHLVGISMGGGIAQELAAQHPDRVRSLTLIATTAAGARADRTPLPGVEPRVAAVFENPPPEPDWTDRAAVVEYVVDAERPFSGALGVDEDRVRGIARIVVDRTRDVAASMSNHWVLDDSSAPEFRLAEITAPTLVLHGTSDPFFPLAHGRALAYGIPGARLLPLDGMGHEVPPPPTWDVVVPAIVAHTASRP